MSSSKGNNIETLDSYPFDISYRSDRHSLIRSFFIPAMARSNLYQRAVGYFTSTSLARAAKGIATLIGNEGRIQLIASPNLTEEDIKAINDGYKTREGAAKEASRRSFPELLNKLEKERLAALSWLISENRLEIKLAIRIDKNGNVVRGIYHEKIGIFHDDQGNSVAFTGSSNESESGFISNFESIDVYKSWDDPSGRVAQKQGDFERLWNNETKHLDVLDFNEVTEEILRPITPSGPPDPNIELSLASEYEDDYDEEEATPTDAELPSFIQLRSYQTEAINNWLKNGGKGIFKLATGTGKTIM